MTTIEADRAVLRLPLHARISEEPATYLVELDVAGFDEVELDLSLHGRSLTVVGEHDEPGARNGIGVHERLEETFSLPDDVLTDRIEAFFRRGTLEIKAPRSGAHPESRRVPVRKRSGVINADATPC
jgi:HSP20 family molecular chaperone IbpA